MKRSVFQWFERGAIISAIAALTACTPGVDESAAQRPAVSPERQAMLAQERARQALRKNGLNNETLSTIASGTVDAQSASLVLRQRPSLPTNDFPAHDVSAIVSFIPTPKHTAHGEWRQWETATSTKRLATLKEGVLIAPVQTIGYRFNQGFLSAMSLGVAHELNQLGVPTYDPILVHRALGIGRRQLPIDELTALARQLNARALVIPYAGHNADHQLFVSLEHYGLDNATREQPRKKTAQTTFADDDSPFAVAMTLIEPMIKQVISPSTNPVVPKQKRAAAKKPTAKKLTAPRSLIAIANLGQAEQAADVEQAMLYQWMATLAPDVPLQKTLLARSLVMIRALNDEPVAPILRARALTYLGAAPAARTTLSQVTGAPAQAALAFSNGQLTAMKRALKQVRPGTLRDLLLADLVTLQAAAKDDPNKTLRALSTTNSDWRMVVHQALAPTADFRFLSNVEFAPGLEKSNVDVKPQAVRSRLSPQIDVEVIQRLRDRQAAVVCESNQYCARVAFEDLMHALAIRNAMRGADHFLDTLSQREQGEQYLVGLAPLLRSHPSYERSVLNNVLGQMGSERTGARFESLKMRLQQAQRWIAANADYSVHYGYTDGPGLAVTGPSGWWHMASQQVFPPAYFARKKLWGDAPRDQTDLQRELNFMSYAWAPADDALASEASLSVPIAARYGDHPDWITQQVAHLESQQATPDNINARRQFARTLIKQRPDLWDGYYLLGFTQAIYGNQNAEAAATFWRFPGFNAVNQDNVLNTEAKAAHAARYFFWRGHFAQSKPFLQWITQRETGSGEYLRAEQRLAAINARFARSAGYAQARLQRYDSGYGLRDLAAWLFASGDNQSAWGVFNQTKSQAKYAQIWLAAQVGARLEGRSWEQNLAWLQEVNMPRPNELQNVSLAAVSATGLALMDRLPASNAANQIRELESEPVAHQTVFSLGDFTQAMQSLYAGETQQAATQFEHSVAQWRRGSFVRIAGAPLNENHSMVLPYATYARVKATGQAGKPVEPYVLWSQATNFNHELANAFRSGLTDDTAGAVRHLTLAMNEMPYAGLRPIYPAYQWAQACVWLYRDTGQAVYKKMALDWAIKYQTIMPWQAWPYALEATFTKRTKRRAVAASLAHQLDPHSLWFSQLPEAVKRKAIARKVLLPWMVQFKALGASDRGGVISARK